PTPTPTPTPLPLPQVTSKPIKIVGGGRARPTPTPEATAAAEIEEWKPTAELSVQYSSGIRFNVEWPRSLRAFAKNPFLGTGFSSVTLATDNDYLRLLAETGLLGFITFFLIFLEIGRQVIGFARWAKPGLEKSLVLGLTGGAVGLLANAVFIDVFESSKIAFIFWLLMGILVGIIKTSKENA
ncbi:MAG: O-antigen ligase family protein, partial [Candidatus Shapirobacteria bacterium]|nr:O-antigen ligase family protein [Candidatus Shapirobacteria bacterium]